LEESFFRKKSNIGLQDYINRYNRPYNKPRFIIHFFMGLCQKHIAGELAHLTQKQKRSLNWLPFRDITKNIENRNRLRGE
jgi:hypothetical protein